jgi:hypothetical protein
MGQLQTLLPFSIMPPDAVPTNPGGEDLDTGVAFAKIVGKSIRALRPLIVLQR